MSNCQINETRGQDARTQGLMPCRPVWHRGRWGRGPGAPLICLHELERAGSDSAALSALWPWARVLTSEPNSTQPIRRPWHQLLARFCTGENGVWGCGDRYASPCREPRSRGRRAAQPPGSQRPPAAHSLFPESREAWETHSSLGWPLLSWVPKRACLPGPARLWPPGGQCLTQPVTLTQHKGWGLS